VSDELTLNATLAYDDGVDEVTMQIVDRFVTLGTLKFTKLRQSIGTSEEALQLGEVTSPGWLFLINRDATNYVDVKVATSGAIFARLHPDTDSDGTGGFCLLYLGTGAQAPFLIANTAACIVTGFVASV